MNRLLIFTFLAFTFGMIVLSSSQSHGATTDGAVDFCVDTDCIVQEYEPPSRGRSGNGIGSGTRFDGRITSALSS